MALKLILLFVIGLLCYSARVLCLRLSPDFFQDLVLEEMFLDTFNPLSIGKNDGAVLSTVLDPLLIPDKDVTFHLFTRDNPEDNYLLKVGDVENLRRSPFKSEKSTKIIIHGWSDSVKTPWMEDFRRNYLITNDYNVISVNWFPVSTKEYGSSAKLTRQIGEYVGELLDFLKSKSNLSLSSIHILGHSLGAHIAGFAGSKLAGAVGRITGMDPARPLFEAPVFKDQKDRLDATDALFVDVIHTCAGTVGFIRAIGHTDFYPNGGTFRQPGCSVLIPQYCSHGRSHQFIAESIINPEGFVAVKCDNWMDYKSGKCSNSSTVFMGDNIGPETRGIYYLETNAEPLFGRGIKKTR